MQQLLKKLNKLNISVSIKDAQLDIKAPKGAMTKELISEIKTHKDALLSFLNEYNSLHISSQIIKVKEKEYYRLSSSQYRIWLLQELNGNSSVYNMPSVYYINGKLDVVIFEESINKLIEKHEILRTNFKVDKKTGKPVQFIHSIHTHRFKFEYLDYREEKDTSLEYRRNEELNYAFDLENESLLRVSLIKTKKEEYQLIFVLHHIISDAWSSNIILEELLSNYKQLLNGKTINSSPLNIQYKDYAEWQREQIVTNKASKKYWLEEFNGEIPVLELPTYKTRPSVRTNNGVSVSKILDKNTVKSFEELCATNGASLFIGFQTLLKILLFRYTGQQDIIIGSPISGRELPELQNQIGFFVNTLALQSQLNGADSFLQTLDKVKETTLKAYEHQDYPFDRLIQDLNISTDRSRNPLFDIFFTVENSLEPKKYKLDEIQISEVILPDNTSKFDLEFDFNKKGVLYELKLTYNTDLYTELFVNQILAHIQQLLLSIVENPLAQISILGFLSKPEQQQLLEGFNNTKVSYFKDKTIVDLFEEQVEKAPNNVAVVFEDKELTYQELNERANQLADYLQENYTIEPDDLVAIKLDRSENLIIAILGILKSEAAYVPIDTDYPEQRIEYIEKDSNAKVVIDSSFLEEFERAKANYSKENITSKVTTNHLAYVIYTSGTTGNPKGVMVEHKSVLNQILWYTDTFDINEETNSLLLTSYTFDPSTQDIFGTLIKGGKLHLISSDEINDLDFLYRFVKSKQITILNYIPNFIDNLLSKAPKIDSIKSIIVGGESLSSQAKNNLINKGYKLFNNYGPTETTVDVLSGLMSDRNVHIGRPISNTHVYILDANLELLPIGVSGKLYISGDGLARGYLNRPELTKEKFIANPFIEGSRMYDTGDLAKWLPDGNIEFLGRKDHQIKLRGYRIELGEIENTVLSYSKNIHQAVALVKNETLVVYYTREDAVDETALNGYLKERLPSYMLPNHLKALESIPLTPSGKIDRKQLENLSIDYSANVNYVAPRNEIEQKLVEIWQEVLGIEKVGIQDNFFELGGHSLLVGQVINQIYKHLEGSLTYKEFFQDPIIERIAKAITRENYSPIPQVEKQAYYPLTPSQHRIWVLSQLEGGSQAYNMSGAVSLQGALDLDKLKKAFSELIARHEVLRTCFKPNEEGEVHQYITDVGELSFDITLHNFEGKSKEEIDTYIRKEQLISFDLTKVPLLRVSLLQTNKEEHLLSFTIHHIIGDGWSMELLTSEIVITYNKLLENRNYKSDPLSIQYKDYSVWLQSQLASDSYKDSEVYWLDKFQGELPILNLPSFKKRPLIQTYNGKTISHQFSKEFLSKLKQFSKSHDATLFITLMSGINALLYRYTNQDDIIIGTPIAGREHPDLEQQIGLYLNTLAIRTQLKDDFGFEDLLQQQKQTLLEAYEHQIYPFDALVSRLDLKRDTSRSALFDVMVVLQNQNQVTSISSNNQNLEGIQVKPYELERKTSQMDVSFAFAEENEGLHLEIEYNTDIYDDFLTTRMFDHFESLLNQAIDNPKEKLLSIDYLTEEESKQILETFNNTKADYPSDSTIVELFEEQVEKTPNNVAVVLEDKELTYQELNERANQLAGYLQKNYKIQSDDLIAIKLDRSEYLLVVILGILKSGAAYVPIDTNYPQQRIEYIEKDSDAKVVIDQSFLEGFEESSIEFSKSNVTSKVTPSNLAYVIYTSGTTGNPKGVMVEHRNAIALLYWAQQEFDSNKFNIVYAATSHCFDLSVYEMFYPLSIGKHVRLLNDAIEIRQNLERDTQVLINTVPSSIRSLMDSGVSLENISIINLAGESFPIDIAIKLKKTQVEIRNLYGPSEDTTYSTVYRLDKNKKYTGSIPIGKPLSNTQVYILDDNLELLPIGVSGRLYISGDGLARGYLNRPELTKEKFIANPFIEGKRMYDTGDLAKWLPDGNIEFIGRKDEQIKLRGYRIELGEIENTVHSYSKNIHQAVALVKDETLVVYYTQEDSVNETALNRYLKERLPSYMLPNHLKVLESIPLTPNGKIDRKQLETLHINYNASANYVAPRTEIEQKLVEIWQEVLGIEKLGIYDDFFDLGGHSLKIVTLSSKINGVFNVKINIDDLFNNSQIRSQAEQILHAKTVKHEKIEQLPVSKYYELSQAQLRLFLLEQMGVDMQTYNIYGTIDLEADFVIEALESAVRELIRRHEILRTRFVNVNGIPKQEVLEENTFFFKMEVVTVEEKDFSDTVLQVLQEQVYSHAFDINEAPLFKFVLLKRKEKVHLLYVIHHIISDGWSQEIFVRDTLAIYKAILEKRQVHLPPLTIQYKDYANWQNKLFSSPLHIVQEQYWLKQLGGSLPNLKLFHDYEANVTNQPRYITLYTCLINEGLLRKIRSYIQKEKISLFSVFIACFKLMLHRITGENDMIIGTPVANRNHHELNDLIGYFLNILMLRSHVMPEMTFEEFLTREHTILLEALEHQSYPFEMLLEKLNIYRRSHVFPITPVVLNMLKFNSKEKSPLSQFISQHHQTKTKAKVELECYFEEHDQVVQIQCAYDSSLFKPATIQYWMDQYVNLIDRVITDSSVTLNTIKIFDQRKASFNNTKRIYSTSRQEKEIIAETLLEKFEEQVRMYPEKYAVCYKSVSLSYSELNEKANGLAKKIQEYNLKTGNVALLLNHDQYTMIGILGVLKSGNAYIPLNPGYPVDRLVCILQQTICSLLIVDEKHIVLAERLLQQFKTLSVLNLSTCNLIIKENPDSRIKPESNAYILYTSGSTGAPKGVVQNHQNVLHFIQVYTNNLGITKDDNISLLPTYSFDSSVMDIFGALLNGATLYLYNIKNQGIQPLSHWLIEKEITIFHTVPTIYRYFMASLKHEVFSDIRLVVLGGEAVFKNDVDDFKKHFTKKAFFVNGYGPTESTITLQKFIGHEDDITRNNVPIGYPVDKTEIYLLDENDEELEVYQIGEIVYKSNYLALGYYNQEEITNRSFTIDPIQKAGRVYRSGDLGRRLPNGEIEFIGRKDGQIKLNGLRIETSEIEQNLLELEEIAEAIVVLRSWEGQKKLTAFLRTVSLIDEHRIKRELQRKIPTFMIPEIYVFLETFPLTASGKINRRKLTIPNQYQSSKTNYVAPKTPIEISLTKIWFELLKKKEIGVHDNFFELGGNSIKIILMMSRINKYFDIEIETITLFTAPTIWEIAGEIENILLVNTSQIVPENNDREDFFL